MSHELRTPLHAIGGFGEILLTETTGSLNDQQRHYLRRVIEARNLLAIINDILEYARTDESDAEPVDASSALSRVVGITLAALSSRIADKHTC